MLYCHGMNMGTRIAQVLAEKNWQQVDLLAKVPDLEPATLSAIIKRDSKWSDYAPEIAAALGVHLIWLLRGSGPQWLGNPSCAINEAPPGYIKRMSKRQQVMVGLMEEMTEKQQDELIRRAEERAEDNREVVKQLTRPKRN